MMQSVEDKVLFMIQFYVLCNSVVGVVFHVSLKHASSLISKLSAGCHLK